MWVKSKEKYSSPQNRPRRPRGGVDIQLYSFFNFGAICGWVVYTTPWPLQPRERPGTHCTGSWVGPRVGLDRCGKTRSHRDTILGPSSPQRVAIPAKLSQPTNTRDGTLIVATIYLQLIQNRYMFRSFTVLHCSHQHCVQPVASDGEVVGYLQQRLSPCGFDLIPKMKEPLRGIRFRTVPEILQAVDRSIRTINTTGAAKGIL